MRSVLFLVLVGLLAAVGSSAPLCVDSKAPHKVNCTTLGGPVPSPVPTVDDDAIIYLPPTRPRGGAGVDGLVRRYSRRLLVNATTTTTYLDARMQALIAKEMATDYQQAKYVKSLKDQLCPSLGKYVTVCEVKVLEKPTIKVIPTKLISDEILCSTPTCAISRTTSASVTTTHSGEVSVAAQAGFKPFNIGVQFTTTFGYGYSRASETSTSLEYTFNLERGDTGYIGMVNAQISAKIHILACASDKKEESALCVAQIVWPFPHVEHLGLINEIGHHEAVILRHGRPRSFVTFIYTAIVENL